MKFKTTILQTGNNTGIEVTEEILRSLGGGNKPLVIVTVNGHTYQSAVGNMNGKFMISLSAENRNRAGIKGGDSVDVALELDTVPRSVDIPEALQMALDGNEVAKANFEKLAPSKKKAAVLSVTEAKTDDTRKRRIEKIIEGLN